VKSVTHSQSDARPTVTFPAVERQRRVTGTKLCRLMTEAQACEQLAQGRYAVLPRHGSRNRDLLIECTRLKEKETQQEMK